MTDIESRRQALTIEFQHHCANHVFQMLTPEQYAILQEIETNPVGNRVRQIYKRKSKHTR